MRDKASAIEPYGHVADDVCEQRSIANTGGGQTVDEGWADVTLRLNQCVPRLQHLAAEVQRDDANLDDSIRVVDARGFAVDYGKAVRAAREPFEGGVLVGPGEWLCGASPDG